MIFSKIKKNCVFGFVLLAAVACIACNPDLPTGEMPVTVSTITPDLFYCEVSGEKYLDVLLANGGSSSTEKTAEIINAYLVSDYPGLSISIPDFGAGCSAFKVSDGNGGYYFGRNFDFGALSKAYIIKNIPGNPKDYISISTFNPDFVKITYPDGADDTVKNEIISRLGVYVPLDGVNEKGLMIAVLDQELDTFMNLANQMTPKPDITTTLAVRAILDKAATVDEAIELLNKYDMHSDLYQTRHYFIADATGKSVVVDWDSREKSTIMVCTETDYLTNHPLYLYSENLSDEQIIQRNGESSVNRFNTLKKSLNPKTTMTSAEAKALLKSVNQGEYTRWSIIYHITSTGVSEKFYWRTGNTNWDQGGYEYGIKSR